VHGLAADRPRRRLTNSKERRPQRRGKRRSSKRVTDRGSLEQRRGRGGEDERLHERPLASKPAPAPQAFEPRPQLMLVATEIDLAAPAAKARLHDVRGRKPRNRNLADVSGPRLLDADSAQEQGRRELVVRCE
jgi:hypothetical protein